jgi:hypothetical protein
MTQHIDIVLAPVAGTSDHMFIDTETADGKSVKFGGWITQNDGSRAIRFTADDCAKVFGSAATLRAALAQMTPKQRGRPPVFNGRKCLCGCTITDGIEAAADALEQEAE